MNKKQLLERLTILVVDEAKWSRLEDYLEATEDDLVSTLKTSKDIREINKLQGKLELLTQLLNIPNDIRKLTDSTSW
ncbi:hypothetical protein [Pseudoalteromonas phage vB_PtuP_Slicky01]|nr:hypothetical protein [Pseudoalteromonas phage vB_PtuP_Slicky01]